MRNRKQQRGNATIEFTLMGLPLIFVLVSIASMAFSMYTLHTLQQGVAQSARYVTTHAGTCTAGTNSCGLTVGNIASLVAATTPGVFKNSLSVKLIPNSGTANQTTCNPVTSCYGNSTVWPPSSNNDNNPGGDITIVADFTYSTPIAMFWPGVSRSSQFGSMAFHAVSRQRLMF